MFRLEGGRSKMDNLELMFRFEEGDKMDNLELMSRFEGGVVRLVILN